MGIPLYRERSPVVLSPQTKLPVVCPYAVANSGNVRYHHHHHQANALAHHVQTSADPSRLVEAQSTETNVAPVANTSGVPGTIFWRPGPRQLATRERSDRNAAESNERSTATSSSRYTQRLVRSQPGSREYEDEMRAAELVDMYFQELYRFSRVRQQEPGSQLQPI